MARAIDISDGICAYLQGGLGNQLFILAAAWEQSVRLDCPLYIDTSRFISTDPLERSRDTPREFDLKVLDLPGVVIGDNSPWCSNSPRRPAAMRRPGRRSTGLSVYRQRRFGFEPKINEVRPGTTVLGYFQSHKYFDSIAPHLRRVIADAALTESEKVFIDLVRADPRITVHLRRGDYLAAGTSQYHGIATANYIGRALDLFEKLVKNPRSRVYSDSPDLARQELDRRDLEFVDDPDSLGTVATLLAMSAGTGFVMSNSSFSWWAAWLMAGESPSNLVVAPRPWQSSGESASDLLLPEWITLDAR